MDIIIALLHFSDPVYAKYDDGGGHQGHRYQKDVAAAKGLHQLVRINRGHGPDLGYTARIALGRCKIAQQPFAGKQEEHAFQGAKDEVDNQSLATVLPRKAFQRDRLHNLWERFKAGANGPAGYFYTIQTFAPPCTLFYLD